MAKDTSVDRPTIEKTYPVQERSRYPFRKMEVGDSFLVKCDEGDRVKISKRVSASMFAAAKRCKMKFSLRSVTDGVRVWRVA